jgi:hypothetical protein
MKPWTTTEHAIIRKHYAAGGINTCEPLLPKRSRSAIYQQARILGCKSDSMPAVRQAYAQDPHIDQQIRFAHQTAPKKGDIEALAERVNRPAWWVSRRARDMGLVTPRFSEPVWTAAEMKILGDTEHLAPTASQRALKRAGFTRTLTAVIVKRKRLGIYMPERIGVYTTGQLGELLGYERSTPSHWVKNGLLQATMKSNNLGVQEAEVTDAQLREFLIRHPLQVDLRRLPLGNRPWFIELLTGRGPMTITEALSA